MKRRKFLGLFPIGVAAAALPAVASQPVEAAAPKTVDSDNLPIDGITLHGERARGKMSLYIPKPEDGRIVWRNDSYQNVIIRKIMMRVTCLERAFGPKAINVPLPMQKVTFPITLLPMDEITIVGLNDVRLVSA